MQLHMAVDAETEPSRQHDPLVSALLKENERLQAELNEQHRSVELYRSVFNCLPDGLAIADQNRAIQICNPGLSDLFGYSKEEMIGQQTALLYESVDEFRAQGQPGSNMSAEEQLAPYEVEYKTKHGRQFTGETIGTPLRNRRGTLIGYLGAIRDVTEREEGHSKTVASERLLNLITNSLPDLATSVSADRTLRFVNSTSERWYGRNREDLIGCKIEDVLGPNAARVVNSPIDQALKGQEVKKRAEITYPDGVRRAVEISYVPDIDHKGQVLGFVACVIDMTKQRNIERELSASESRLTDAINAVPDGFAYYDKDDRLQVFNEQYRMMYPKCAHSIVEGATFEEVIRGGAERGQYRDAVDNEEAWIEERPRAHQTPGDQLEQRLDDGRCLRIEERKTRDGGTVSITVDITETKRREKELELLSVTDVLTGLANRRSFLDRIAQEHNRVCRYGGVMSVLLIDVDHFKRINDTHGHLTGDVVLRELAAILAHELRDPDVVCRYGGEEFAAFLPETSMGGAFTTAERVREAVQNHNFCSGNPVVQVSVSIGVTQSDRRDKRYESALVRADQALYKAKEAGRNQVVIAPPDDEG